MNRSCVVCWLCAVALVVLGGGDLVADEPVRQRPESSRAEWNDRSPNNQPANNQPVGQPAGPLAEELTDLRRQVGPAGVVAADDAEFAEAVERVARDAPQNSFDSRNPYSLDPRREFIDPRRDPHSPVQRGMHSPPDDSRIFPPQNAFPNRSQAQPPIGPGQQRYGWVGPPGFDSRAGMPSPFGDRFQSPPNGPRPPHVMLRETAFELDRMAHELEMADLYAEADALRTAGAKLRETARRDGRKGPARVSPPSIERPRGRQPRSEGVRRPARQAKPKTPPKIEGGPHDRYERGSPAREAKPASRD